MAHKLILLILTSYPLFVKTDLILESPVTPTVGTWGTWGNWEECPPGEYATGFQLKVEANLGYSATSDAAHDDTSLNAVKLFCNKPGAKGIAGNSILSSEGNFGSWGQIYQCDVGLVTGFQLQEELHEEKSDYDDTAVNNVKIICSDPSLLVLTGDGIDWGVWKSVQHCSSKQAVCGIQTRVDLDTPKGNDSVGLVSLNMKCCDVPDPTSCCPKDQIEAVATFDNQSPEDRTFHFQSRRGISITQKERAVMSVGYSMKEISSGLKANFDDQVSGHNWEKESSITWAQETTKEISLNVPAGTKLSLEQVVGVCRNFRVYTNEFAVVEN